MSSGREGLVNRQVRAWEARQQAAREQAPAVGRSTPGPWLAVSREVGSGGTDLAALVGRRLGWDVFDQQIVQAIAERQHVLGQVVERHDEHASGVFDDYLGGLIVPHDPGQAGYLQQMKRVIGQMADQGRAVIVGRGAHWLLNRRYGLSIRVIAPLDDRIQRLAARHGLDPAEARRRLAADDAARRAFVRQTFQKNIDDPLGYDMVVNSATLPLEAAAEAVIAALYHRFGE